MVCDIHAYMEYREREPRNEYAAGWRDFGGRINPGRHYHIFELMAGVRGEGSSAVVPPRGFPDDAAYAAQEDQWTYIAYGKTSDECSEEEVDEETAKRWASYRPEGQAYKGTVTPYRWTSRALMASGEYEETSGVRDAEHDGKPRFVASPDWHSHSWLTVDEYAAVLGSANYASPHEEPEYHAILAALRSLEASGYEARIVFWFDN